MGLFRKKEGDIIDFTMLQKRGILKKEGRLQPLSAGVDQKTGFVDLTSSAASPAPQPPASQDLFGFLDASASSSTPSSHSSSSSTESLGVQSLKVKIDDLEFKLERLLEKIALLEEKVTKVP